MELTKTILESALQLYQVHEKNNLKMARTILKRRWILGYLGPPVRNESPLKFWKN